MDTNDAHFVQAAEVYVAVVQPCTESNVKPDGDTNDLALNFSVRSILIWTTIIAILLGGYIRWHLISLAVLAVAMPVAGFGIALVALGVLLAARRKLIRATAGDMLVLLGAMVMMLSVTIIGIGLVLLVAELLYFPRF